MRKTAVAAPVSFLLDPNLTATAKALWLTLRLERAQITPGTLCAITGLTYPTVRKGLAQLESAGLYAPGAGTLTPPTGTAQVSIPAGLLADRQVSPQGKLIYGLLQTLPDYSHPSGSFTFPGLSCHTGLSRDTLRDAIADLGARDWLTAAQAHRKAPIRFTLCDPDLIRRKQEVDAAAARLEDAEYKNEQIMKEYLSLLIDTDNYTDNARPGFLPNPDTNKTLELDRFYHDQKVGFEYQGAQHFSTTERFPSKVTLSKQQFRDAVKRVLCEERGMTLVVVCRHDLSLQGLQAKIGKLLPLRDLRGHEDLTDYLERLKK
ncbi:MAG: hypothetical protein K0R39_1133 [Symbiobacteriaceae bacterium]|nr:hypothetical protein [Symbiobacteriaceae bacterium]